MLGARCVGTLLHEMKRRGKDCRFGVISMCIGLSLSLSLSLYVHVCEHTHTQAVDTLTSF
jgi:acetyl-CoA acetyltransferase